MPLPCQKTGIQISGILRTKLIIGAVFSLLPWGLSSAVAEEGATTPRSELRRQIHSQWSYHPTAAASSQTEPQPESVFSHRIDPSSHPDADVIVLPKMEVNAKTLLPVPAHLARAIERSSLLGPQNQSTLGTGIHEHDFGRTRVGCITVFYVPVKVYLQW